jgi:8-oxo-dGTP diphosphatase
MRRSVAGIAADGTLVFIARRVSGGSMGNKWEFPGGKVEDGETDTDALIREFQEESPWQSKWASGLAQGNSPFENRKRSGETSGLREVLLETRDFVLSEHTERKWESFVKFEGLDFGGFGHCSSLAGNSTPPPRLFSPETVTDVTRIFGSSHSHSYSILL